MIEPTRPKIDRALMERDLAAIAELLAPAIEARLAFLEPLFAIPMIGPRIRAQLQGSPLSMTLDALRSLLELSDDELADVVDVVGAELGAWRGFNPPVDPPALEAAGRAYDHLLEVV